MVKIHPSSYIDEGAQIGDGTSIWHFCHIQSTARIGKNCSLGQNVNVAGEMGDNCRIQNNVSIYQGVTLEDGVFCGPSCVFTNVRIPRAEYPVHGNYAPTLIRRGASLGANCTIVCGHTVGRYAMIAAGAVVASDVPDFALMAGVPARQIGWVDCEGNKVHTDPTSVPETISGPIAAASEMNATLEAAPAPGASANSGSETNVPEANASGIPVANATPESGAAPKATPAPEASATPQA